MRPDSLRGYGPVGTNGPESFDAVLADWCNIPMGELQRRLAAAHVAEVGELQLDNVNLRKGWQHQVNAVNAWADRCIEQEDRAVAAEARAEAAEQEITQLRSELARRIGDEG